MTRTPPLPGRRLLGRRTGADRTAGQTALLALVVVAVTATVLALAGTTPRTIGAPTQSSQRVELDQRTFTCAGDLSGAIAVHGTVDDGIDDPVSIGTEPQQFDVDQDAALGAFAGQESRTKDWLAWLPCPEPRARWWFVGAGAATVTHDTVLTVANPRIGQAVLDIDVLGPHGPVSSPGLHGITVPAHSTRVVDLAKVAPAVGELAVSVVATRGLVSISAADRFAPGVVGKAAQEWLPGQSLPSRSVILAGLPPKPDSATLVVANPRQVEAVVAVEAIGASGTFAPHEDATLTVPPGSTATVPVRSVFDGGPVAIKVTSPQPVTAAIRTVTGGDVAFATAVRPVNGTTALAVPSGAGQLVLSSIGPESAATLTAFGAQGKALLDRKITVPKGASVATGLPAGTRYLQLVTTGPDAVAGFSVTDPSGVATAGVTSALGSVLRPVVRPGW
jgi:hypothetical protein